MATVSVISLASSCLGKEKPLSLKEDILGVYGNDHPLTRSLKQRLDIIENDPFVRLFCVIIQGATPTIQRDLDNANEVYQNECGAWIYCIGTEEVNRSDLFILQQDDCVLWGHRVSADEDALFDLGRDKGADIVCYYIDGDGAHAGCAAHPRGRRGFWVGTDATPWTFVHELTHVIGGNLHCGDDSSCETTDTDNLMFGGGTQNIQNLPPDLNNNQRNRILGDPDMRTCS